MVTEGFEVVDALEIGSLEDVKEEKQLVPPAKNVKFKIAKAELKENDAKAWRWIGLTLQLVDGVQVEGQAKYAGKTMFQNVCYFAEPGVYTSEYFKKRQHLVALKQLLVALSLPLASVKISEEMCAGIVGQYLIADIRQSADTIKDENGKRVKTGDYSNEVINFKEAKASDLV